MEFHLFEAGCLPREGSKDGLEELFEERPPPKSKYLVCEPTLVWEARVDFTFSRLFDPPSPGGLRLMP